MQSDEDVQERKPSTTSTDSNDSRRKDDKKDTAATARNWSCNAGDSGGSQQGSSAGIKPCVTDQNWSGNAGRDVTAPKKEPCPISCGDFEFKMKPPTGSYISLVCLLVNCLPSVIIAYCLSIIDQQHVDR